MNKSYLQKRVYDQMSLTEEQCTLRLTGTYMPSGKDVCIFQSDEHDNIDILVYDIHRRLIEYEPDDETLNGTQRSNGHDAENMLVTYKVKRYNPDYLKEHPDSPKYKFPGGSTKKGTYPFIPPRLIEKYEAALQNKPEGRIDTLVLTEGYFKAMCASVHGVDIIGLGSVTLFSDSKTKRLYNDVVEIIKVCKPNNIVVLYDGDCTDISEKSLQEVLDGNQYVDLSKRPAGFLASLRKLRDLLLDFKNRREELCELFFLYVSKVRETDPPKGLDDLLCDEEYKRRTEEIVRDLNSPGTPSAYFERLNLRTRANKMSEVFNLTNAEQFYSRWHEQIGEHQFGFRGGYYKYSAEQRKLIPLLREQLKDFLHVGNTIYYRCKVPSAYSEDGSYRLLPRDKSTVDAMFGKDSAKDIIQSRHYEDFVNVPSHTNYKQDINRFFNMYCELSYSPEDGKWTHIQECLTHLFGKPESEQYQMVLDYLQIMYTNPTQKLPVLALVSEEHGTGKTAFLNLVARMFEENCIIGDNELIMGKFNSLMAGKLAVCIDETNLQDNKEVATRIKYLTTTETLLAEAKGKDKVKVDNYMKLIMTSNEPEKFVYPDKDENRYWIIKVTSLTEEEKATDLNEFFADEVPHFVYYLLHRKLFVDKYEGRLWFKPERYLNENFRALVARNMSKQEKAIRHYLHDLFLDCNREKLELDVRYFKDNVEDFRTRDETAIRDLIEYTLKVEKSRRKSAVRVKMPFYSQEPDHVGEIRWSTGKVCRPYVFYRKYFVDDSELTPDEPDESPAEPQTVMSFGEDDRPF